MRTNLHNKNRPKRHTSDTRPHKRKRKKKEKGEEEKQNKNMVELKTKSRAQKEAKASELHPWRLELEIFPSRLPCGHPYRLEQRQNIAMNALPTARNFFHALFFTFAVYSPTFFGKSSSRVGPRTKIGRCVHRPVFGACTI